METILKHSFCAHVFSFIIISEDRSQISANTKATLRVNASTRPSFDFSSIRTLLTSKVCFYHIDEKGHKSRNVFTVVSSVTEELAHCDP